MMCKRIHHLCVAATVASHVPVRFRVRAGVRVGVGVWAGLELKLSLGSSEVGIRFTCRVSTRAKG